MIVRGLRVIALMGSIIVPLYLFLVVVNVNVALVAGSFGHILGCPGTIDVNLLGRLVLLPVVNFTLTGVVPLQPRCTMKIVLLILYPNNAASGLFAFLTGNSMTLSIAVATVTDVVAMFDVPVILDFSLVRFVNTKDRFRLPVVGAVVSLFIVAVLPVDVNVLVGHFTPEITSDSRMLISHFNIAFLAFLIIFLDCMRESVVIRTLVTANPMSLLLGLSAVTLNCCDDG